MENLSGASVAELWRYPVKSMRGERVEVADVVGSGPARRPGVRGRRRGDRQGRQREASPVVGRTPAVRGAVRRRAGGRQSPPAVSITLPDGARPAATIPMSTHVSPSVLGRPVRLTTVAPETNSYLAVWPEHGRGDARRLPRAERGRGIGTRGHDHRPRARAGRPARIVLRRLGPAPRHHAGRSGTSGPWRRRASSRWRATGPTSCSTPTLRRSRENDWSGTTLQLGDGLAAMVLLPTMRCIMTTLAQGDLPRDNNVLRTLDAANRIEIPGLGDLVVRRGLRRGHGSRSGGSGRRGRGRLTHRSAIPPRSSRARGRPRT